MIREPEYLAELRSEINSLVEADQEPSILRALLHDHIDEFKRPFVRKSKNAEARQLIQSGKFQSGDIEYSLNTEFINETLRLSDQLSLDECIAAEYLLEGSQQAIRYDRSPFACAAYLYYATHTIILDVFRHLLMRATDEVLRHDTKLCLQIFISDITQHDKESKFSLTCLELLALRREQCQTLADAEKRGKLLQDGNAVEDADFIKSSLVEQHEAIALSLAYLARIDTNCWEFLPKMIDVLKRTELWDVYVNHYVICVTSTIQAVALSEKLQSPRHSVEISLIADTLRRVLDAIGLQAQGNWKLLSARAILEIVLAVEINGLCKEYTEMDDKFDYEQEILELARQAMDYNVFQHFITFHLFTRQELLDNHPFTIFFSPDAMTQYRALDSPYPTDISSFVLEESSRAFVQSFIINLADLLKQMRSRSEDAMLVQELKDNTVSTIQDHHDDLFFGLVYTTFCTSGDAARPFWEDKENDLYGFMKWASYAQTSSSIYAFFMMMSVLVTDSSSSAAALAFFEQDKGSLLTSSVGAPSTSVSFNFVFDSLRHYARHLDRRKGPNNFGDSLEIDALNSLILGSYLALVSGVLSNQADPAVISDFQTKHEAITVLMQLIACRLPPELYTASLNLLAAFARSSSLQETLWHALEGWLTTVDAGIREDLISVTHRRKLRENRLVNCLQIFSLLSIHTTIALINLLIALITSTDQHTGHLTFPTNLGENQRAAGIREYVDFVFDSLLVSQTLEAYDVLDRLKLSAVCVNFLDIALSSLNVDLIQIHRLRHTKAEDKSNDLSLLTDYLKLHSGTRVFSLLNQRDKYQTLMAIIKNHDVADPVIRNLIEPIVATTLRICSMAILKSAAYVEFIVPLLTTSTPPMSGLTDFSIETDALVHICMLCSSASEACSIEAVNLLQTMQRAGLLTNRHVAALVTVDYSKAMLLGIVSLLERRDSASTMRRLQILKTLLGELSIYQWGPNQVSVAHFIIGFEIVSGTEVANGHQPGQIGSGHSVLHAIIALLVERPTEHFISKSEAEIICVGSQIVATLCDLPQTCSLIAPLLRKIQYLASQVKHEPLLPRSLQADLSSNTSVNTISGKVPFFIHTRAELLRYCSKELLLNRLEGSFELQAFHVDCFVSTSSSANDRVIRLLDFLDVLEMRSTFNTTKDLFQILNLEHYGHLMIDPSEEDFARLRFAIDLQREGELKTPNVNDSHKSIQQHYQLALSQLHDTVENNRLRQATLHCFRHWALLTTVILDQMTVSRSPELHNISGNVIQYLLAKLREVQDYDVELADVLCEVIASAAEATDLDDASNAQCFSRLLLGIQSPVSTYIQRQHLYFAGSTLLQHSMKRTKEKRSCVHASLILKQSPEKLLSIVSQDSSIAEEVVKVSACVFLDLLLQVCHDGGRQNLTEMMISSNLLDRFLCQFEIDFQSGMANDILDCQLCVVQRVSRTRAGARELVRNRKLLVALNQSYLHLQDATDEVTKAMQLLGLYICCGIALGLQHGPVLLSEFLRTWEERLNNHALRMEKAKHPQFQEFRKLLDIITQMAHTSDAVST